MRFGIIGFGSIGRRHAENLNALGFHDTLLLRERGNGNDLGLTEVSDLRSLFNKGVDQVVLSNPTAMHAIYLKALMEKGVNILSEKPLLSRPAEVEAFKSRATKYAGLGMVAYNMRFHPCVKEMESILASSELGKIYSADLYVGQYLPDWRPDRDYHHTYSSQRALGGGVGLDLIHEIDLAVHLFGIPCDQFYAIADHVSDLDINVEDIVKILYRTREKSIVSIHLDYLTKGYRRDMRILGEFGNLYANLAEATLEWTESSGQINKTWSFPDFQRNDMYLDLMRSFIHHVKEGSQPSPSLQDGLVSNEIAFKAREDFYHDR